MHRRLSVLAAVLLAGSALAGPPATRPGHPHLAQGGDRAEWTAARRNANAAANGLKKQKLAAPVSSGNEKVRHGTYTVGKGAAARSVGYTVTERLAGGSNALAVTDTTAGVTVTLTLDDQAGEGTITVGPNTLQVGFNPDGTVSVGGTPYDTVADAAWAVANDKVLSTATAAIGAAMVEIMGALAEEAGSSRGNAPTKPGGELTIELGCNLAATC